ncbi:Endonuclease III-like protein 1 [Blomia tropicalis]|nr:Endonuclease III-like protein 1 [Blomia tropicalis]
MAGRVTRNHTRLYAKNVIENSTKSISSKKGNEDKLKIDQPQKTLVTSIELVENDEANIQNSEDELKTKIHPKKKTKVARKKRRSIVLKDDYASDTQDSGEEFMIKPKPKNKRYIKKKIVLDTLPINDYESEEDYKPNREVGKSKKPAIKANNKNVKNKNDENGDSGETLSKLENGLPSNWREIYDNIVQMRKDVPAVTDTMGCEHWPDKNADERTFRFQALIGLMLSSQTREEQTFATMNKLKEKGLNLEWVDSVSISELKSLLIPVAFYNRKAEYIKKAATILKEKYDGDIPNTIDGLTELPGVGPKMAHLIMPLAWNEVTGIAVDTHVHRITNRLKWIKTKTPEQSQTELEKRIPHDLWHNFNSLMVGFGQSICKPVKPNCSNCLNKSICPSSNSKLTF